MSAPNYRILPPEPNGGQPMTCCWSCKHERSLSGTSICIRYRLKVAMREICDDWDGGKPLLDPMGTGQAVWWYHERYLTEDELVYLNSRM